MIPEGVQTHTVTVNDMAIQYYQAGQDGPPVVLLHGGGVDSAMISWSEVITGLAERCRVFAPDLPGYGGSAKPNVDYTLEFYAGFLCGFLDALGLEKASLAGLSLGGGISLRFALDHPGRVEKLVLVDAYGIMPRNAFHLLGCLYVYTPFNDLSYRLLARSPSMTRQMLTALVDESSITDDLLDEVLRALRDPAAGRAFQSFQRSEVRWNGLRSDFTPRLGEIRAPTLFLHGEKDTAVPLKWAERAHAAMPGSRLVVLKGRKHWPLRDNPQEVVEILLDFLASE